MKQHFSLLMLAVILTAGCGTSTHVTGSWRKPNATAEGYKKIFITAMSANIPVKQAVEDGLQKQLRDKGLGVVKSMDVFPPNFSTQTGQTRQYVVSKIQDTGADGILTIALLRKETESRYQQAGGYWNPGLRFGYYGRFWNYYNNWYPQLYAPGYYDETKIYYIETNLYNAETEELIWAAQTETYDPANLDSFLKGYIKAVHSQMVKDGLVNAHIGQ